MRNRVSRFLAALAVLAMALPAWARRESTELTLDQPAKLEGTQLKPGDYRFVANDKDNKVNVWRDGKRVAEVQAQWVQLNRKSPYTDVLLTKNQIKEIDFAGKSRAIRFK